MDRQKKSQAIHVLFDLSIIGKGINGALEVIGGALLCFTSPDRIHSVVRVLTQHELSEDPKDLVATCGYAGGS